MEGTQSSIAPPLHFPDTRSSPPTILWLRPFLDQHEKRERQSSVSCKRMGKRSHTKKGKKEAKTNHFQAKNAEHKNKNCLNATPTPASSDTQRPSGMFAPFQRHGNTPVSETANNKRKGANGQVCHG
jgi:hypothetical protein